MLRQLQKRTAFFCLILAICGMSLNAQTKEVLYDFEYEGLHFKKLTESTVEISPVSATTTSTRTLFEPNESISEVPGSVSDESGNWYDVVGIGAHAFEGSENVSILQFGYDYKLQYIGDCAFQNCKNLVIAEIPCTVNSVGANAFNNCPKLEFVLLGVTGETSTGMTGSMVIKDRAFYNTPELRGIFTGLQGYSLPESDAFGADEASSVIKTFYITDSDQFFVHTSDIFSRYDCVRYGRFKRCSVTYNGPSVMMRPEFVSNMPSGIEGSVYSVNQPYETNAGSGESTCYVRFTMGHPYSMTFGVQMPYSYVIEKAPLCLMVKDYERCYGEENPEFEIEVEGYVNGEGEEIFSSLPKIVNGVADWAPEMPTKESPVGEYELVAMADLKYPQNYELTAGKHGKLTITKAKQQITWDQELSSIEKGKSIELNAAVTSGEPVSYSSSNPEVAEIEGNVLKAKANGTTEITASHDGTDNYFAADPVVKTLTVSLPSAVNDMTGDKGFTVSAEDGKIKIIGVDDRMTVKVYYSDGRCLYSGKDRIIPVDKGIYIVIVGRKAIKIAL